MKTFRTIAVAFGIGVFLQLVGVSFASPFPTGIGGLGTSITPASGTIPIGNGAGSYTPALLTPGSNISIANGSGTIVISATGGSGGGAITISPVTGTSTNFSIIGDGTFFQVTNPSGNTIEVQPATTSIAIWANHGLYLIASNNLSDLTSTSTARTNLGLGSAALQSAAYFLVSGNNLSDLQNTSTARANLGLGSAATQSASAFLQTGNNLSDLTSTSSARSVLGYSGVANQVTVSGAGAIGLATTSISQFVNDKGYLTSAPATSTLTAGGTATGPNITIATTTASRTFNFVCSASTCTLTIPPFTDYLASSTVYVSSVNGSNGAVTITSSSLGVSPFILTNINGTASTSFYINGVAGDISSSISGASTTFDLASIGSAGSCINCNISIDAKGRVTSIANGSSGGASSTTLYAGNGITLAPNPINTSGTISINTSTVLNLFSATSPITFNASSGVFGWTNSNGYATTTIQSVLNSLSAAGLASYNSATGVFTVSSSTLNLGTASQHPATDFLSSSTLYVSSFNTRNGAVTLSSSDVTTALGFTPISTSTNLTVANLASPNISQFTNNVPFLTSTTGVTSFNGSSGAITYAPSTTIPTVYVSTFNGASGAVAYSALQTLQSLSTSTITLATSTQAGTFTITTSNGNRITFTIPPAGDQYFAPSTTIPTVYVANNTGNWAGTWQGVNSSSFYLASNPNGFGTSNVSTSTANTFGAIQTFIGDTHNGTSTFNSSTIFSTVMNALHLGNASGVLIAYTGSNCSGGQFVTGVSASGTVTCATTSGGASSTQVYGTNGVTVTQAGVNATATLNTAYAASWTALESFLNGITVNGPATLASSTNCTNLMTNASGSIACNNTVYATSTAATPSSTVYSYLSGTSPITFNASSGVVSLSTTTPITFPYINPTPITTAAIYYSFGDSITAGYAATTTGGYVALMTKDENVTNYNQAIGGEQACDMGNQEVYNTVNPSSTFSAIFTMLIGTNDANNKGAGTYENVYKLCHQAAISWITVPSNYKVLGQSASTTLTGTWSNDATYASGVGIMSTTTASTASFPITTYGGPIYIWYKVQDGNNGTFTYKVDGGSATSVNASTSPAIATQNGNTAGVGLIRITGVASSTHTVLITVTSPTGTSNIVGILGVGTPNPVPSYRSPKLFSGGVPYQQADQNSAATAAYNADSLNDVALLASDGLPVFAVNVRAYVNSSTDMGSQLHPNDVGYGHMRDAFEAVEQFINLYSNVFIQPISVNLGSVSSTQYYSNFNGYTNANTSALNPGVTVYCNTGGGCYGMDLGYNASSTHYATRIFTGNGNNITLSGSNYTSGYATNQNQFTDFVTVQTSNGYVGIGSSTPGFPLVVSGTGQNAGFGAATVAIVSSSTEDGILLQNTGTGGGKFNIFTSNNGSGVGGGNFVIGDASSGVARVTINSAGAVTINSNNLLDASGNKYSTSTVAGSSTITVNGISSSTFRLIGDGSTVTSTQTGATTTFSVLPNTYYPYGTNPAGYVTSSTAPTSTFARAVTKVVCASNAIDTTDCDYKATGTNDNIPIQNAINAIASSSAAGGIVYLSEGAFTVGATSTIKIQASGIYLIGAGQNATYLTSTGTSTPIIQVGNSQSTSSFEYPTSVGLADFNASLGSQTSTVGVIYLDGFGNGSFVQNVTVNNGGYGVIDEDADRNNLINIISNNPYIAGIFEEEGTGNSYGNVTLQDSTIALSHASSSDVLLGNDPDEPSPVPLDRLTFSNNLFHANLSGGSVIASTTGLLAKIATRGMTISNSLFESNKYQVVLNSEDHIDFSSDSWIQDSASSSVDCIQFNNLGGGNAFVTFDGQNKFQNCTNMLDSYSGSYPTVTDNGLTKNDGSITNLVVGSYSYINGTDVNFYPAGTLTSGLSTAPYSNVYAQNETISGGNLLPASSYASNIGSSGALWNNIYTNNITASGAANLPNTVISGTTTIVPTSTIISAGSGGVLGTTTVGSYLGFSNSNLTVSSTIASSSITFGFYNATTTKPFSYEYAATPNKKNISYVDCSEYAAATTTIELYYNTTNASTGIQQVILPSISCGIAGNSTTTFTTSTLPTSAYLFAIVSSTVGTPTLTTVNIFAQKL